MALTLTYEEIAARFPEFTTDDPIKKVVINSIIVASALEIDAIVWGDLALEGLYYLVASKLIKSLISEMAMKQAAVELSKTQESASGNSAQKVTVEGEYTVEYSGSSVAANTGSGIVSKLLSNADPGRYQREYERLMSLLDLSPLYSG
jgi:hypothetical protein